MNASQDGSAPLAAPAIDHMFAEAERLLLAAREAARLSTSAGMPGLKNQVEALRVTARLSQTVAWLLAAKAVAAGEISATEMARDHSLDQAARTVCLAHGRDDADLPPMLQALLEQSLALYRRVARLDALLPERPPFPAFAASNRFRRD